VLPPEESHAARRQPGWRRSQTDRPADSDCHLSRLALLAFATPCGIASVRHEAETACGSGGELRCPRGGARDPQRRVSYWQINGESGTFSMAPALPPCNGEVLADGFTYLFRNPHRGEIVMFRARGSVGGEIVPTAHRWNPQINKRVIGFPATPSKGSGGGSMLTGGPRTTFERRRLPQCTSATTSIS
jgi:hypothetical protein